jgi:hypothetical protein
VGPIASLIEIIAHAARDRVDMITKVKLIAPLHTGERIARDIAEGPSGRVLPVEIEHLEKDVENVVAE